MKIVFYCQYVWGMGHLFRSIEIVRALSNHSVTLVAGGQHVDIDLPKHSTLLRLPVLFMDEKFTTLIPGSLENNLDDIRRRRKDQLFELFERQRPDLFMVELYPFGRTRFGFELEPLLQSIRAGRFGNVKSVCSLRDILVEKKDPRAYEERVLSFLERYFDLLLIHSDERLLALDETFQRVKEIPIPLHYTGFIAQPATPQKGARLRHALKIAANEKLIVASAGGGRSGYRLLNNILDAYHRIGRSHRLRLEMFTGPFMENEEFNQLSAKGVEGIRIRRFTKRFLDYLYAADLSVSLAGYNTCMNLLTTGVPALVYPYSRQQEQPMRVEKIKNFIPVTILREKDIEPRILSRHIEQMLLQQRSSLAIPLNLDGARNTARFLNDWAGLKMHSKRP